MSESKQRLSESDKRLPKSRPIPLRLSRKADAIVRDYMEEKKLNNRNLSINEIIEQHDIVEKHKARTRERLLQDAAENGVRIRFD